MGWPEAVTRSRRAETHFGGRAMRCFADRPATVTAMVARSTARDRTATALITDTTRLSYADLDTRVERVAGNLAARGVIRGDRVAIILGNRPEFLFLILACCRLGAIAVPMGTRMKRPEYDHVLTHSGARMLIHEAALAAEIPTAAGLEARFVCGGPALGAEEFTALLAPTATTAAPDADIGAEDPAVILYTSGTTGRPKGAILTHLGLVHSALHFARCWRLGPEDRCVLAVPASHVTGLVAILLTMLGCGGATIIMPEFHARDFLELAAGERATATLMVPAMYNLCLRDPALARFDLSPWRVGGYGGAPMPEATIAALAERLPGLVLVNAYGATETTSPATIMPLGATAGHADSVGRVVPCGALRVVDDAGREVAPGNSGEIEIAGPMVIPGYWNDETANRANFRDGYWISGDIGSIDADGFVRIHDRKKDMINRAGYKVYSAEVENVLSRHPDIVECAVVARPDPVLGERVHAYVVTREAGLDEAALRAFCAARLADYKVPETIARIEDGLPRNANGKVRKAVLRDRLARESPRQA